MAESESNLSDEELMSAYCDGELRGAELTRAEQRLAAQPECRQLLDEFRALRARLQEVPPRKLGDNFADRVLRRAERELLTATPAETAAHAATPGPFRSGRFLQGRRPWVYVSLALAAALFVMLVESKDTSRVKLAQQPPLPAQTELSAPSSQRSTGLAASTDATQAPSIAAKRDAGSSPSGNTRPPSAPHSYQGLGTNEDPDVRRVLDSLGWPAVSTQAARQAATVEQQLKGEIVSSDLLVVECRIEAPGVHSDSLAASFLRNSIDVEENPSGPSHSPGKADHSEPVEPVKSAALPDGNAVELFFVVASPAQLSATLADFGSRPGVTWRTLPAGNPGQFGVKPSGANSQATLEGNKQTESATQKKPAAGRARRLTIPRDLRRVAEQSSASTEFDKAGSTAPTQAEKAPQAAISNGKSSVETETRAPPPAVSESPATKQRALFILRVRPADGNSKP
jgi:negative regulator of sigma E activity